MEECVGIGDVASDGKVLWSKQMEWHNIGSAMEYYSNTKYTEYRYIVSSIYPILYFLVWRKEEVNLFLGRNEYISAQYFIFFNPRMKAGLGAIFISDLES